MYDLIGFWSGVTLLTWALSIPIVCILLWSLNVTIKWASRDRVTIEKKTEVFLEKYLLNGLIDDLGIGIGIVSFFAWVVFLLYTVVGAIAGFEPKSLLLIVSDIALFVAPVMGALGIFATVFGGGAIIMRKVFDMFFGVKDKLDKLENGND